MRKGSAGISAKRVGFEETAAGDFSEVCWRSELPQQLNTTDEMNQVVNGFKADIFTVYDLRNGGDASAFSRSVYALFCEFEFRFGMLKQGVQRWHLIDEALDGLNDVFMVLHEADAMARAQGFPDCEVVFLVIFVFGLALAESEFEVEIVIMERIELLFEFSDALLRCGCGGFVHGIGGKGSSVNRQ